MSDTGSRRGRDDLRSPDEDGGNHRGPQQHETYDLLRSLWLPAVALDGRLCQVGLVDAVLRAHELRWIDAEAPVVTAALHRLLLAFAHRVYGPGDESEWAELWEAPSLPAGPLEAYLDDFGDRFDLFGERPFFQTPGIPDTKIGSAAQLTMYRATGNNVTLFDHTVAEDRVELHPADAARWLVTVQAYDTGGMKTPFDTDKSSERGLCNHFATLLVEGATLKETLLLNMPVYAPGRERPHNTFPGDLPIWERDEPTGPKPVKEGPPPAGWTELLTWPSRRIRLRPVRRGTEIRVDGAAILPGTRLRVPLYDVENMAAFERDKRSKKGAKGRTGVTLGEPRPVVLEDLRGIWRHSRELLLPAPELGERIRPRTLDHIADMARREHIPPEAVYTLRVFGQRLDPQAGAVRAWLQESLPTPIALLRADRRLPQLEQLLGHAVELADGVGKELDRLERGYAATLGERLSRRDAEKRRLLTQWYWPELVAPFGMLLQDLGAVLHETPPEEPLTDTEARVAGTVIGLFGGWSDRVRRIADQTRHRWVDRSPRKPGRDLIALADHDRALKSATSRLYHEYGLAVRDYWPVGPEEDE
ncbi:type I-E CRISPR-associated protein Cse1/CasA [Spinactinospora alkalitolerans]|uniref:type I-E CRISPR-associated protein Cse1/CasA n=1 Tax=Spinactinospora alkalitolerans TaxID=687207 RepID=UPI002484734C|nr:type I-E CRISPR-associated protein Cse1/CasA [Spinactinospora alkalitolerans]